METAQVPGHRAELELLSNVHDILDECKSGILVIGTDGIVDACNTTFQRTFPEKFCARILGRHYREFIRGLVHDGLVSTDCEDSDSWIEAFHIHFTQPHSALELRLADNTRLAMTFRRLADNGMVLTFTDVTEIQSLESQGGATWAHLEMTLDNIAEGICLFDRDVKVTMWNSCFFDLLDIPPDLRGMGTSIRDIFSRMAERGDFGRENAEEAHKRHLEKVLSEKYCEFVISLTSGKILEFHKSTAPTGEIILLIIDITKRREIERELNHATLYDLQTGLPNKQHLIEQANHLISQTSPQDGIVGLLSIGIKGLNEINLGLGPDYSEAIARKIAGRIADRIDPTDIIARTGVDEFAVIFDRIQSPSQLGQFAANMISSLAAPFDLGDRMSTILVNIGISVFPLNGRNPTELLNAATLAMQTAARISDNQYKYFTSGMSDTLKSKIFLEESLRAADYGEELEIHYQPQISLKTLEMVGVEALLRWDHPDQGFISPAQFIPVAEASGVIAPLGLWILRSVCRQLETWTRQGIPVPRVAINISATQFKDDTIVRELERLLSGAGFAPERIQIEITENIAMEDVEETAKKLDRLHALGVKLSIDDFGTGYSSLAYLKNFPFDELKIDRMFIRNITTDSGSVSIVKSILSLGHNLGMRVLAEGVETREQNQILTELGCDDVQGFLYSRAVNAAALTDFLAKHAAYVKDNILKLERSEEAG